MQASSNAELSYHRLSVNKFAPNEDILLKY